MRSPACLPTMEFVRRGLLTTLLLAGGALGATATACPFCGPVPEPLATRRARSTTVAIAETVGPATVAADGSRRQRLQLLSVFPTIGNRVEPAEPDRLPVLATVTAEFNGTALLFEAEAGNWQALAADELLIGYCLTAPAPQDRQAAAAERLAWFARWLEHPNAAIAADAYAEYAVAPFAAVRDAAGAFDANRLADWLADPAVDQQRRGFYGLAAGLVARARARPDHGRCREAIMTAVSAPNVSDFRAGYDGLLAGLFIAAGIEAPAVIESLGLLATAASPVDQRHLLQALRFCWEEPADTLPQPAVVALTRRLLASPNLAREAVIDLARYQAWDACDAVVALWPEGAHDPLIRPAIAGYLQACPTAEAQQALTQLRATDNDAVEAAIKATRLPLPAAG
ncbi:MAG: hypothetical protein ACO37F_06795 [Pirellulales bacterium]